MVIGTLLLLFGVALAPQGCAASAGVVAMHDEKRYRDGHELKGGVTRLGGLRGPSRASFSRGVEVVFIVVAVGGTSKYFPEAIAGGLLAMLVVA